MKQCPVYLGQNKIGKHLHVVLLMKIAVCSFRFAFIVSLTQHKLHINILYFLNVRKKCLEKAHGSALQDSKQGKTKRDKPRFQPPSLFSNILTQFPACAECDNRISIQVACPKQRGVVTLSLSMRRVEALQNVHGLSQPSRSMGLFFSRAISIHRTLSEGTVTLLKDQTTLSSMIRGNELNKTQTGKEFKSCV